MSLWSLPLESLTIDQLDTFLQQKLPEGSRLDYKVDVPKDLGKVIAAFANTLGGMIVLGVDEDKTTTEPIWPPDQVTGKGLATKRGLAEQITQIARDNIYPPVRIQVSSVIENPHLPDHSLLVIRVDASKEAPHAVERRRIYIYERNDRVTDPYELADIDHISRLLDRRKRIEEDRERMVQKEIDRGQTLLPGQPIRWAAVVPWYPWRELYRPSVCYSRHVQLLPSRAHRSSLQQMPDGSYLRGMRAWAEGATRTEKCSRLNSQGLVFHMELTENEVRENGVTWISFVDTAKLLKSVIGAACGMYEEQDVDQPGHLMVSIGILNARSTRIYLESQFNSRNSFLDDTYREDYGTDTTSLLKTPLDVRNNLLENLAYAFDMPPISDLPDAVKQIWQ